MAKKLMCTKKFYYFFSKFLTTPNSFFTLEKLRKKNWKGEKLRVLPYWDIPETKKKENLWKAYGRN